MYTAIYKKVRSGYLAWIEEIPGVNTQGASRKEARANLADALSEFLIARRALTKRARSRGASIARERLSTA
ncbi:HicB family protein [Candidatus Kaiserbacteria bacterium CG10_big_fil_rev_8_21_14_0_10_56_12]|uniref:HicB family protein n=1 Tax=Candidatus Kaiserbacteria bacterium CG10_big_fil_rev_8_21_14_0_10_56_12 TaxID=1974611 RepID=A0A2H0UBE9_9BACT|nr:MAG: HicB family protein [Candidatus Kaiserbacteria bacterium CG10_big_fil_rev_8_21_14_0_10_56_12]